MLITGVRKYVAIDACEQAVQQLAHVPVAFRTRCLASRRTDVRARSLSKSLAWLARKCGCCRLTDHLPRDQASARSLMSGHVLQEMFEAESAASELQVAACHKAVGGRSAGRYHRYPH